MFLAHSGSINVTAFLPEEWCDLVEKWHSDLASPLLSSLTLTYLSDS